jgi:hypothetical protein
MKLIRLFFFSAFILNAASVLSQNEKIESLKLDPDKVRIFEKYPAFKHGLEPGGYEGWKSQNPLLADKEMWYYTESFYIKRNHLTQGITLDESVIDISRFETQRKPNEETIVTLNGFKDVIVLIPANKLIYKPE